ncbi:hypothetical protein DESC_190133 [Desulfosarcina cetonica]|uniref:hypothetical protein n=1 Tax=Desulfosarcina cetonica TaxID=90730 RepID=UPI0012ED2116|nr:hypothetical protein [Desulfosarcina cetonica]VTR64516.1 hypothetical protein DESC_190133 [Desulfosarcina cetonica]
MTFLGDFQPGRVREALLRRSMVVSYVRQLFKRSDFPQEIFIALADSTVSSVGDIIWANLDNEHLYDFIPMPCIDQLVLNLPSKTQFLKAMGAENLETVDPVVEENYWQQYSFNFADSIEGVKISWH